MRKEPAYTPRAHFECDGSTTHYQGCKCHEARWAEKLARLEAENLRMREALEGWMESYKLMTDKTDGILRDSIRGFFLNCPWNTKQALSQPETERLSRRIQVLEKVKALLEIAISIDEPGEGCKSVNVAKALAELKALDT